MKLLGIVLAVQVALGITLVALVATDNLPFTGDHEADGRRRARRAVSADRFDGAAAFRLLRRQVELGPRPAGSPESRRLARLLKRIVPRGRYQEVPGGLRNVIGTVRGREPGYVVVGAHYDTKDIPGFVGANDGASGTAVAAQLARTHQAAAAHGQVRLLRRRGGAARHARQPTSRRRGCAAARSPRRRSRTPARWSCSTSSGDRRADDPLRGELDARACGGSCAPRRGASARCAVFPRGDQGAVSDDHLPFLERGVPSIDLIDFDFPCWHRRCDDMSAVSERSVNAVGETIYELLKTL